MNLHRNTKLKTFVDGVMTRIANLVKCSIDNIAVDYNAYNDVYWFVRKSDAALLENQTAQSLDELQALPRMVQMGVIQNNMAESVLLLFMNERGAYSHGIPHTLPAANCTIQQSKEAAQTIFNYLTNGEFTGGVDYSMVRVLNKHLTPVVASVSDEQAKANREQFKRDLKAKQKGPVPITVYEMKLMTRLYNILRKNQILLVETLAKRSVFDLLAIDGVGDASVRQIQFVLEKHGLSLKGNPKEDIYTARSKKGKKS